MTVTDDFPNGDHHFQALESLCQPEDRLSNRPRARKLVEGTAETRFFDFFATSEHWVTASQLHVAILLAKRVRLRWNGDSG